MSNADRAAIQITKFNGQFSFVYFEYEGQGYAEASQIDELEKAIGMKGVKAICEEQICTMLHDDWDGRWESLLNGWTYLVNVPVVSTRQLGNSGLHHSAPPNIDFPYLWELLGFALRKKTRERIFEPARQDLVAQYLKARQFSGKWERRWLTFCFSLRTFGLILNCYKVATGAASLAIFMRFLPPNVKEWLLSLFR